VVKALAQMASAVWDKESEVNLGFKRLVAYMASRTHGCNYSMAHAAEAAHRPGVDDAKLERHDGARARAGAGRIRGEAPRAPRLEGRQAPLRARQKAEGRRQKAEGRRQKAEGRRQPAA
jgi:hypothetical protein